MLTGAAWLAIWLILSRLGDASMVSLIVFFAIAEIAPAALWYSIAHTDTGSRPVAIRVGTLAAAAIGAWFGIGLFALVLLFAVSAVFGPSGAFSCRQEALVMVIALLVGPIGAFYVTFRNASMIANLLDQHAKPKSPKPGSQG